jgi:hypothetical protein
VYSYRDTLFLEWNLKNITYKNLLIPTLFSFRRLDGDDQQEYQIKEDFEIKDLYKDEDRIVLLINHAFMNVL